jgi:2Fe-2S ferredoxin
MARVTFRLPGGREQVVEYNGVRESVMVLGRNAGVPGIIGDCGGFMACATCHVHVAEEWLDTVGPASNEECALIALTADPKPESRLGCQLWVTPEQDGLTVTVAQH